ncbi:MAG: hypothetical protein AB7E24_10560 [Novosphingobium sp.]
MQERDFKAEIEAARNDPAQLRKIADEIQAAGGSRLLMIRAIQRARAADTGPHPLGKASAELGLPRPTGLPLYRYKLAPGSKRGLSTAAMRLGRRSAGLAASSTA